MPAHSNNNIHSKVDGFMSIYSTVLEKLFVKKNYSIDAKVIIHKLKEKKIDFEKVSAFMSKLPEGEWNINVFLDNISELNEIFGFSDEELTKHAVSNIADKELMNLKWQVMVESMSEYSRFSTEFYDALKYNDSNDLSISQTKLLTEFMRVFKYIKEHSNSIYESFCNKKYSEKNLINFNKCRVLIEFLMLRILYITLNLRKGSDDSFKKFAELLGKERIALTYQKYEIPSR